jgi:prepilin-type N-terminal cleavage/methylation domain-containing protein
MSSHLNLRGFTLVEMAVVLVILGLILGGLVVPLSAQMEIRNYSRTKTQLDEIKEALIGYAIINGRLPCPATAASSGLESFCPAATGTCVGTETTTVQTHGNCSAQFTNVFSGFLPAATLGISPQDAQGFTLDAWGGITDNRIRYAVSSKTLAGTLTAPAFTTALVPTLTTAGMKTVANNGMGSFATQFLYLCGTKTAGTAPFTTCGAAGAVQLADNAVFVVYSVGKNATEATSGISIDEAVNPNPNSPNTNNHDVVFVSHEPTPTYDDILVWTSVSELVNKMVNAGQLP